MKKMYGKGVGGGQTRNRRFHFIALKLINIRRGGGGGGGRGGSYQKYKKIKIK